MGGAAGSTRALDRLDAQRGDRRAVGRPPEAHDRPIEQRPDVAGRTVDDPQRPERDRQTLDRDVGADRGEPVARRVEVHRRGPEHRHRVLAGAVPSRDDDLRIAVDVGPDVPDEAMVGAHDRGAKVGRHPDGRRGRVAVEADLAEERVRADADVRQQPVVLDPVEVERVAFADDRAGPGTVERCAAIGGRETQRQRTASFARNDTLRPSGVHDR